MARAMYVHPTGEPSLQKSMKVPKRASSLAHWFKEAKKACIKDIGDQHDLVSLTYTSAVVDLHMVVFRLGNGGQLVVDRTANALGR